MPDLLLVMNPRKIAECLTAFRALDIDKLWIRYMTEARIAERWPEIMELTQGYDRILIGGDDSIPHQHALDAVIQLLDDGHPVATGYSNLSATDYRVNLAPGPLMPEPNPALDLYTLAEAMEYPEPAIPTTLVGFTLTGMSRDMWLQYPFRTWFLGQTDYSLAKRLERDGVPIVAAREAFVWHVKEQYNFMDQNPRKRLYVEVEPEELFLDARVAA